MVVSLEHPDASVTVTEYSPSAKSIRPEVEDPLDHS